MSTWNPMAQRYENAADAGRPAVRNAGRPAVRTTRAQDGDRTTVDHQVPDDPTVEATACGTDSTDWSPIG